jgi:hypothetical protein
MKRLVKGITDSILNILQVLGLEKWKEIGFADLKRLAFSVEAAISEDLDTAAYHRLSWLRTWMFWIDLRRTTRSDEQVALTAHFYALVLVMVPLFPGKYSEGLINVCLRKTDDANDAVESEKFGVTDLLDSARRTIVFTVQEVEWENEIEI